MAEPISVLMTVYDGEVPSRLRQSLESLAVQTLPPTEVVVVADGPIGDHLRDVIRSFVGRFNIGLVTRPENRGAAAAANADLRECSHELVARLDSDDVAVPERLALQSAFLARNAGVDILGGYAQEFSEARPGKIRRVPAGHDRIISALWSNPIINSTVMFRRSKIQAAGGYDETLRRGEDYDLWFRCAAAGLQFDHLQSMLVHHRFSGASLRRASPTQLWRRAVIGFNGSRRIGLSLWKQLACFAPFLRGLLPAELDMFAYRLSQRLRP